MECNKCPKHDNGRFDPTPRPKPSPGCDCDFSDYYTKEEVDDLIPEVSGFATKTELQTVSAKTDLAIEKANELETSKQDKLRAGDNISITDNVISAVQPDISNLATKTELTNGLNTKQDTLTAGDNVTITNNVINAKDTTYTAGNNIEITAQNVINADLSNYYNKTEVDDIVDGIVTGKFEVVQSLPQTGEDKVIYLVPNGGTAPDVHDEYIYVNGQWEKIGDTNIDLSDYATKTELATKQDKLTAGDNVTIANGVISATDTTYTAGNNITITNGQISATFTKAQLLEILGYEEITISKTDSNGNTVTAKVLGYIE